MLLSTEIGSKEAKELYYDLKSVFSDLKTQKVVCFGKEVDLLFLTEMKNVSIYGGMKHIGYLVKFNSQENLIFSEKDGASQDAHYSFLEFLAFLRVFSEHRRIKHMIELVDEFSFTHFKDEDAVEVILQAYKDICSS